MRGRKCRKVPAGTAPGGSSVPPTGRCRPFLRPGHGFRRRLHRGTGFAQGGPVSRKGGGAGAGRCHLESRRLLRNRNGRPPRPRQGEEALRFPRKEAIPAKKVTRERICQFWQNGPNLPNIGKTVSPRPHRNLPWQIAVKLPCTGSKHAGLTRKETAGNILLSKTEIEFRFLSKRCSGKALP